MFLAIDIGGSNTRIAMLKSLKSPQFVTLGMFPTNPVYGHQAELINDTLSRSKVQRCEGIGISIGAQVARDGLTVEDSANLPDYVGKPIVRDLSRRFRCTTRMAHDAVCGLIAEGRFGRLKRYERCAYLTLSTGTGAAIQLRKGKASLLFSIEVGHQILDGNQLVCLCGQIGCLETITGGKQIELRLGQPASSITSEQFWETYCDKLAIGLVNLAMLTRIDAITISGGIGLNNQYLKNHLQIEINRLITGVRLEISWALLGENSPLIGAAALLEIPEGIILH